MLKKGKNMLLAQIEEILGGEAALGKKLTSKMDLFEIGNTGLTKNAIAHMADYLALSWKQVADLLPVTERTIQRYKSNQHFNMPVSEQALQIAEVTAKGVEVFEDKEKFLIWLNKPHKVFSGKTPFHMLHSHFGTELVMEELGRIEFGVYS
jgi:putative toxin-antitoxin system antitoxin component (TIGR02293 family)